MPMLVGAKIIIFGVISTTLKFYSKKYNFCL